MNVLIFGATGSAGGSVLRASLASPLVKSVCAITRRPLSISHEKLRVFTHDDYLNYAAITEAFAGVDACFFCLGISVNQVPEESAYRRITYDFPFAAAQTLREQSPGAIFHYLSGSGAGVESRFMWARVKGEAERDLMDRFDATCWRPGYIDGEISENGFKPYRIFRAFFRLFKPFRGLYVTGEDIGRAMMQATLEPMPRRIIGNAEIRDLATRFALR